MNFFLNKCHYYLWNISKIFQKYYEIFEILFLVIDILKCIIIINEFSKKLEFLY